MDDLPCDLSVVVIARNEEEMISSCLESIFVALQRAVDAGIIQTHEVILADSASTDKTVEIAKKFPIKIVQLRKEWRLSAPAGRYIGYQYASGRYVFFTDGDTKVHEDFIAKAIPYLEDPQVGGVDGYEREYLDKDCTFADAINETVRKSESDEVVEKDFIGKAIYRKDVLDEVGVYNPWLRGGEERDLATKIKAKGYHLLRIPHPAIMHYWAKQSGKLDYIRMLHTTMGWSLGDGQYTRYNLHDKEVLHENRVKYFRSRMIMNYRFLLVPLLLLMVNILGALMWRTAFLWLALASDIAFFAALSAFKARSGKSWRKFIYETFQAGPYSLIRHCGFIIGFLKVPKDPSEYPTDAIIIKE